VSAAAWRQAAVFMLATRVLQIRTLGMELA